ncbi:MAG: hypothetical protein ABII18_07585 [bacterium]
MKKVFIDSDVFTRDLRYKRDEKTIINSDFLQKVKSGKIKAYTSIFNVLEVCGILSYNLPEEELLKLYSEFCAYFGVKVLFPADSVGNLDYDIASIMKQMMSKQSLGDSQISYVINRFQNELSCVVSWNAKHFKEKLTLPCYTPENYFNDRRR